MHYLQNDMKIYVYAMPVLDSRMYIVLHPSEHGKAMIIDPLSTADALPILEQLDHALVLFTHSHYDHISGMNWLRRSLNCTLYCSSVCAENIQDPNKNLAAFSTALLIGKTEEEQQQCMEFFEPNYVCHADRIFDTETSFLFGNYQIDITHTPGHSECSQCIRLTTPASDIVFTGDSLVNGHPVITRLPGGSKRSYKEITKPYLDAIGEDVLIMPGHGDWGQKRDLL